MAKAIASAERNYGKSDSEVEKTAERFYEMMARLEFLPQKPVLIDPRKDVGPHVGPAAGGHH